MFRKSDISKLMMVILMGAIVPQFLLAQPRIPVSPSEAVKDVRPLSFTSWRERQLVEAQNNVIRISNRITLIKATSGNLNEIRRLESHKRVAAKNVELIGELTVEDYFNFYLKQFADEDSLLQKVAQSMTRREMAMLIKSLLKNKLNTAYADPSSSPVLNDLMGRKNL